MSQQDLPCPSKSQKLEKYEHRLHSIVKHHITSLRPNHLAIQSHHKYIQHSYEQHLQHKGILEIALMAYQPPHGKDRWRYREDQKRDKASPKRPGGNGMQAISLFSKLLLQLAPDLLREKIEYGRAIAGLIL